MVNIKVPVSNIIKTTMAIFLPNLQKDLRYVKMPTMWSSNFYCYRFGFGSVFHKISNLIRNKKPSFTISYLHHYPIIMSPCNQYSFPLPSATEITLLVIIHKNQSMIMHMQLLAKTGS